MSPENLTRTTLGSTFCKSLCNPDIIRCQINAECTHENGANAKNVVDAEVWTAVVEWEENDVDPSGQRVYPSDN
jgi:hypothetical protein